MANPSQDRTIWLYLCWLMPIKSNVRLMKVGQSSYNGMCILLRNWISDNPYITEKLDDPYITWDHLGYPVKKRRLYHGPHTHWHDARTPSSPHLTSPIYIYTYPPQIQQVSWLHPPNLTWKPTNGNLQYSKMIFQKPQNWGETCSISGCRSQLSYPQLITLGL
jgi:hypothetical protein